MLFFGQYVQSATTLQTLRPTSNNLGLIGFWSFDGADVVNGSLRDRSGSGAHGVPSSIATTTFYKIGKIGQGIEFDGVDDCVGMGDNSTFDFGATDSFTVAFWYRNINNVTSVVITKKSQSGNTVAGFYYSVLQSQNGDLELRISDGTNQVTHSPSNIVGLNDGRWHHVVAVVNRNNQTISSYMDGVFDGSSDISTVGSLSNTSHFAFGGRAASAVCSSATNFSLDDVRVYSRVLSDTEIKRLSNSGNAKFGASQNLKVTNGLVGMWSFDGADVVNGRIMDRSSSSVHGTPLSIATSTFYTAGKIGQGLNFDGTNDTVKIPHSTTFTTGLHEGFSISAWIKLDGWGDTSVGRVVDKSESTNGLNGFLFNVRDADNNLGLNINNYATVAESAVNSIDLNKWIHVVVTITKLGTTTFYIDNVQSGTPMLVNPPSNITTTNDLYIGSRNDTDRYFDGVIDDVRIYNKVLSSGEITQLYNLGGSKLNASKNNQLRDGLLALYSFDGVDISNGVILDKSGNGKNGTLLNIATTTFYTIGKIGQGVKFDGSNDRMNISVDLPSTYTATAWINPTGGGDTDYGTIYARSDSNSGFFFKKSTRKLSLYFSAANNFSNTALPLNEWTHVAVVNNNGNATFYVNAVADGTVSSAPSLTAAYIGSDSPSGEDFQGGMDEIRFYNRALSVSEIRQLYNMGK